MCQGGGLELPPKEASIEQATTIGLDIAKHVFHVHGLDAAEHVLFRKRITVVIDGEGRPICTEMLPGPVDQDRPRIGAGL